MDKSMIREAANKIRECVDFSWHNIGNSAKLEEARKLLDTILAELDKPGEGVRGTGLVLTDGEIERIAQERVGPLADTESGRLIANTCREFYRDALRYARDNGYLSAPAKAPAEVVEAGQAMATNLHNRCQMCADGRKPTQYPAGWFHDDVNEGEGYGSWPFCCTSMPELRKAWDAATANVTIASANV